MRERLFELFSEASGDMTMNAIIARLLAALAVTLFIYISYSLSHIGGIYSRKFNVSLVALTLLTTAVMIVIGNNLALSLGMVGALSIVRFRTAIKDSRDAVYIFWTIVAGICCGAGDYRTAAVGSTFIFIALLIFGRVKNDNRVLYIIRTSRANEEHVEALIFQRYGRKALLRVKNTTDATAEFIYELSRATLNKDRKASKSITDAVYALGNIEYFNIVMQNDDISS